MNRLLRKDRHLAVTFIGKCSFSDRDVFLLSSPSSSSWVVDVEEGNPLLPSSIAVCRERPGFLFIHRLSFLASQLRRLKGWRPFDPLNSARSLEILMNERRMETARGFALFWSHYGGSVSIDSWVLQLPDGCSSEFIPFLIARNSFLHGSCSFLDCFLRRFLLDWGKCRYFWTRRQLHIHKSSLLIVVCRLISRLLSFPGRSDIFANDRF